MSLRVDMEPSWTSWGTSQPHLPEAAQELLRARLGDLTPTTPAPIEAAELPASALRRSVLARLTEVVGEDAVLTDDAARARHAGGQAYADLVRRRAGDAGEAPDAVVFPSDATQVAQVLRICSDDYVAVVPWGGGTSVVGGLDAERGRCTGLVALDLSRMDRLVAVDDISMLATFEPGIRTPDAERLLAEHGLTLGHVPQSFERASLGGYVVTRSAGQASTGVGRFDDLVAGLRMATPAGEVVLAPVGGSAAGPDLRRLVMGSEGTLGVVTEVTLRVRRIAAVRKYEGWMAPSWDAGLAALRQLAQDGPHPDIIRLSDPNETIVSMTMSTAGGATKRLLASYLRVRGVRNGCLVIVGYDGSADDVRHRRTYAAEILRSHRVVPLGASAGKAWERNRFAAPMLRDTLLDAGALAETLETAATWTNLPAVYAAVREALRVKLGDGAVVGCHVSHIYPTGASLYFTVIASADPQRRVEQWVETKNAVNDAIVAAGGTITHHHAVGTAHRDHVERDLGGPVGVEILRAVKDAVDPHGVLNPGKLIP
ncbi:MAG: FAD-binding oxidoreductase [Frankiaceae bacterium]|nr:FAD-binding oxidoreductase [Frankiaceae bacterium]MBV9370020.1 FAD-binding oxidoreductase [Frankiales bacterium]